MGTTGNWIGTLGGAVGSLFQTEGNRAEANSYTSAAQLDEQNAALTAASTRIQETQTARAVSQTLGTQAADVAGAGFTESGSALDLLKSSAQQGALATSLVNIQGAINENAYAAEAGANYAKAKAANEATTAGTISAIASIGGALVNGSGELATAGKTVASGYDAIFGGSAASTVGSISPTTLSALTGSTATGSGLAADFAGGMSATDTAITSSLAYDTSGVALGATTSAVDAGIASATTGVLSGAGALDAGTFVAGDALAASAADSAAIAAGSSSFLGDIGTAALAAVSVICTAFYCLDIIPHRIWSAAKRYGETMPREVFEGYRRWATPVATRILRSPFFALAMSPIFIPAIYEMAYVMKVPDVQSTIRGRIVLKVLYNLSAWLGKYKGECKE